MHREHAAFRAGSEGEVLLAQESDEEDKGQHEEGDDLPGVPGVEDTAEANGHDDGNNEADDKDYSEEIDFLSPLYE